MWLTLTTGIFEPLMYLLGMGYGMGAIIGDLTFRDSLVSYAGFIGPGLMATSAMNGALFRHHLQLLLQAA